MIKIFTINPISLYFQYVINACLNTLRYKVYRQGYMSLVFNCKVGRHVTVFRNMKIFNSCIGDYTYIAGDGVIICAVIGKYCSISSNCYIGLPNHPTGMVSTHPIFFSANPSTGKRIVEKSLVTEFEQTIIGNDVWIGADVKIKAGVKIGNGVIIGAGAVVTKDIPSYCVAVGIPARAIRRRFDEVLATEIESSKWWDWSDEKIREMSGKFRDPKEFFH